MKKMFKSVVAITLVASMLIGTASVSFAGKLADGSNPNEYDVFRIAFSEKSDSLFSNANIKDAIDFVYSLDLENKGYVGLQDAYIDELKEIGDKGSDLSSYAVYLPKADVYYGTYEGYKFRASYSVYNESYQRALSEKTQQDAWQSDIVNMVMAFMINKYITIAYAAFSNLAGFDDIQYYDAAWSDLTISDEVTSRYIWIEDKEHKVSSNPNSYVIVINDMSRITRPVLVTYPNSPYSDPVIDAASDREEISSPNFYNAKENMDAGLRYYISGDFTSHIKDTVPHASLK